MKKRPTRAGDGSSGDGFGEVRAGNPGERAHMFIAPTSGASRASMIHEDISVRDYLKKKLKTSLSRVVIERMAKSTSITIHTLRRGVVIGRKGEGLEALKLELQSHLGRPVDVHIEEIRVLETDAQLIADSIAQHLARRIVIHRAIKRAMQNAMRRGARGIKIMSAGRLNGIALARKEWCREGRVPLHTLPADIDYATSDANTTDGLVNIKVWVYRDAAGVLGRKVPDRAEVGRLAAQTAGALRAGPGAVEYLTAVFEELAAGDIAGGKRITQEKDPLTATPHEFVADPLASARARGRRFAIEEYQRAENLALLDARDYAGRNERTINEQRQKGELYALVPPGKTRGYRYPKWQFDAEADRLQTVLGVFTEAKANSWVIHSFMQSRLDDLGGRTPAELILDPRASIAQVRDLAARHVMAEQGAS